ncbi:MAG TPA: thiamine phosphate synthase [Kofleriaceae bacterium]|nr:thiamine phosphate synthase [Kofleriaceae bacterium]
MAASELPADGSATPAVAVVAITDRRRMVADDVLATGDIAAIAAAFAAAVARAVADCPPGSVIVQVREKDLDGGPLLALVRAAQRHCDRVVVNDRLDVALAAGAYGVHLPERGLAIADARRLAPQLSIGASRHGPPLDAAPAPDLIQLGTIWPTPSKPGVATLGEAALAWPHGAACLVAVGGIDTPALAERAATAGADAVAVIRAAWSGASLAPFVAAVTRGRSHRRAAPP